MRKKVVEEHVGYEYESYGFKKVPSWERVRLCADYGYDFDGLYAKSPILSVVREGINYLEIQAWAWVWALYEGRGFLCSTEW